MEQVFLPQEPTSGRITPASFPFYTTGEDNLRIISYNAAAGVKLNVTGRLIDAKGKPSPDRWDHTPHTDRSASTSDISLSGSTLLNLTVFASAGTPKIGQTFVIVQLIRGMGAAALVLGTILQGYVTPTQAIGWPGSPIESSISGGGYAHFVQGTDPAAGVSISETVPTGARWEILTIGAGLITSGVAGTRQPRFTVSSGGVHLTDLYHPATLGPGASKGFAWAQGLALATPVGGAGEYTGLPLGLPLGAGDLFGIDAAAFDVGDNWSAPTYYVREWLEAA